MALSNLTERSWLEDPIVRQAAADECLGIVWLAGGSGTMLNAEMSAAGGEALDRLLGDLAKESGYADVAVAPLIPMGHSANGHFSWTTAALHPERVIAAIPIKTVPLPGSLGFTGVPLLYLVGETTEWPQFRDGSRPGDRDFFWPVVRESALALRSADERNLVGVVTDPGGGHFDWSDRDARLVALYIRKACHYRLPGLGAPGVRVNLKPIDPKDGWLTDAGGMEPDRFPPAPYRTYRGEAKKAYWFFDKQMANAARDFEGDRIPRAKQMITFVQDGKSLPVATQGFAKLRFEPESDGITFSLKGGFLDRLPPELVGAGGPLGHAAGPLRFRRITGPAEQIGPDTFRVHFDRGTLDGPAQPKESTIWITAEQAGDAHFRHAVQPGQITIPTRLTEGTEQRLNFPPIPDPDRGTRSVLLRATTDSTLPVAYYVVAGPAIVKGDHLVLTAVPVSTRWPVKVTVVAYQWGRMTAPLYRSATPVERTFFLQR